MKFWAFLSRLILRIMRRICSSCSIQNEGLEDFISLQQKETVLVACWHHHLLFSAFSYNKHITKMPLVLTAKNGWGKIAGSLFKNAKIIPFTAKKAKHSEFKEYLRFIAIEPCIGLIAVDAVGPSRLVKPGVIAIAKKNNLKIVPFSWSASRYWCLPSWDKMQVPLSKSSIYCIFGQPIDVTDLSVEEGMKVLTEALNAQEQKAIAHSKNQIIE